MILKFKTSYEYGHSENAPTEHKTERWNYIDGITDCGVFFDEESKCTVIEYEANNEHAFLALHDEAYLINDSGKTIDKIAY